MQNIDDYPALGTGSAQGSSPFAVYKNGDIDYVNPLNGNVFLRIPLVSFPQRGKDLRLSFYIYSNDKQWFIHDTSNPNQQIYTSGYWTGAESMAYQSTLFNGQPNVGAYVARDQSVFFGFDDAKTVQTTSAYPCSGPGSGGYCIIMTDVYGLYAQNSDGAKHYVGDYQQQSCAHFGPSSNNGNSGCPNISNSNISQYPAVDASGFLPVTLSGTAGSTNEVVDANGVHYTPATVTDANGNVITTSASGWTDSLGRLIPGSFSLPGSSPHPELVNGAGTGAVSDPVPGVPSAAAVSSCPGGTTAAREWDVPAHDGGTSKYYLCYSQFNYQTAFNVNFANFKGIVERSSHDPGSEPTVPATLLSAVVLPNGEAYTFAYDQYLSLQTVTLPTGGSVNYTWQNVRLDRFVTNTPVSRALKTRTVNPSNGQPSETWTYHWYVTIANQGQVGETVQYPIWGVITDPSGNDEERQISGTDDAGNTLGLDIAKTFWYSGCGPHDTAGDRTCQSGGAALLKEESYTLKTDFKVSSPDGGSPAGNGLKSRLNTVTTTYFSSTSAPNAISKTVFTPTPAYGYCNVYSLGPGSAGSPLNPSSNTNCYATNQNQSVASYDYGSGQPGSLLRTDTTKYKWQDPSTSAYLTANLLNLPSSTVTTDSGGHWVSETDYAYDAGALASSGIGGSTHGSAPASVRGNLTSQTQLISSGGPGLSTNVSWYDTGVPSTRQDNKQNTSTYAYSSTYDGAYPTLITNALGQKRHTAMTSTQARRPPWWTQMGRVPHTATMTHLTV